MIYRSMNTFYVGGKGLELHTLKSTIDEIPEVSRTSLNIKEKGIKFIQKSVTFCIMGSNSHRRSTGSHLSMNKWMAAIFLQLNLLDSYYDSLKFSKTGASVYIELYPMAKTEVWCISSLLPGNFYQFIWISLFPDQNWAWKKDAKGVM